MIKSEMLGGTGAAIIPGTERKIKSSKLRDGNLQRCYGKLEGEDSRMSYKRGKEMV